MKIKSILLSIFFLTTMTFVQDEMKTFSKDNFSLHYPKDWEVDTSGMMNTKVILKSKEMKDGFAQNVNVVTQNLTGYNFTLDQFVKVSEDQYKQVPKAKIIASERIKGEGDEKHSVTVQGSFAGPDITIKQYYFFKKDVAYVVTFSSLTKDYEKSKALGDTILNSFKVD